MSALPGVVHLLKIPPGPESIEVKLEKIKTPNEQILSEAEREREREGERGRGRGGERGREGERERERGRRGGWLNDVIKQTGRSNNADFFGETVVHQAPAVDRS